MSTTKAASFMLSLAVIPVIVAGAVYFFDNASIINLPLPLRIVLCLAYVFLVYETTFKYFTSPLRHLPTPSGENLILGNGFIHMHDAPGTTELRWMKQVPNDGIIAWRGLFFLDTWMTLTSPETFMEVLNTNAYDWEKPPITNLILHKILGNGLVVAEGSEHKQQRKYVTPAFVGKNIKVLVPLFWKQSLALSDLVKREAAMNHDTTEISSLTSRATLDIIGIAGLGKDFGSTRDADHELATQYAYIADPKNGSVRNYFIALALLPAWLVKILPMKSKDLFENAVSEVRRIVGELLSEKRLAAPDEDYKQRKDIIEILLESGKFSNEKLTDQLLTLLAAGHETTSSALTWTVYLLCKNPDVQNRLRKDCHAVLANASSDEEVTAELIDSIEFLEAVCNECLRLFPPVPKIVRRSCRQTRIKDHIIPKGTNLVLSLWALNRSPDLWGADAENFNPDRWMGAQARHGGAASPYAFTTFLHGPRGCIGQSFARYELKCLLAALITRFSFRLKDQDYVPIPEGEITIRPKEGLEVAVTAIAV